MIFNKTDFSGLFVIELELIKDKRGFFSRSFCEKEFSDKQLYSHIIQCNVSQNYSKGTIRGLHFQKSPYGQAKLVSCTQGEVYDVIVDLRPQSVAYCQWYAITLSANNYKMVYIPDGFAHGFQALKEHSIVFYQMFQPYHSKYGRGIRWNDKAFSIKWPLIPKNMTIRDMNYPDFKK